MNYKLLYEEIILKAQQSTRSKQDQEIYYERHHIIPRCMNGSNNKENLVLLTAKEHFICHHLLTKIYPSNKKLHSAFYLLCNVKSKGQIRDYKITATVYETAKIQYSRIKKEYFKIHPGNYKGKKHSLEIRKKISKNRKGKLIGNQNPNYGKGLKGNQNPNYGKGLKGNQNPMYGKYHSKDTKNKMSLAKKGKSLSEDHKRKIKLAIGNRIWIHNNITEKMGFKSELNLYLSNSWIKGRLKNVKV